MSTVNEYSAFREQLYSGGSGGQIIIGTPDDKVRRRGVIVAIIIIVVILILVVLYFLLIRKKKTTSSTSTTGTTGTTGGTTGTTGCTGNSGCSSGQVCNKTTGKCVICVVGTDCPAGNLCNPNTFTCHQCIVDTDCTGGSCDSGTCCYSGSPAITSVTTVMSSNSSFTVNYTYPQVGNSTAQVEVTLQTPSGITLSTKLVTATGSATLSESNLGLTNQHLFPGISYQVRIRIKYSCTTITNAFTGYTPFTAFTMPTCATGLSSYGVVINNAGNPLWDSYNGVVITFPSYTASFPIGVISSATSGIHPNLAENYYPVINTTVTSGQSCIPLQGCTTYYNVFAEVPYGGAVGTTYYYRYFNIASGQCISPMSSQITFLRGF